MRTLVLDIETSPSLAYVWNLFQENIGIGQLADVSEVICVGAKWTDESRVMFASSYYDGRDEMIARVHGWVSEADAIVGYNSAAFDMKHLHREFLLAGHAPPAPYVNIDLYKIVRAKFKFQSHKLQHVAEQLGIGSKVKHSGFDLWRACLTGDEDVKRKAWRLMRRYCLGDVRLTEALYERLKPWAPSLPNPGLYEDGLEGAVSHCPRCGSEDFHKRGFYVTYLGQYQRFQCQSCAGWFKASRRLAAADSRSI